MKFSRLGLLALIIPTVAAASSFHDVPDDAWFAPYVSQAVELGIVNGYTDANGNPTGMFGPGDQVTVTQALKMEIGSVGIDANEYHVEEIQLPEGVPPLPSTQEWWYKYFLIAREQKTSITGCGFDLGRGIEKGSNRAIRRWEMALLIADIYQLLPALPVGLELQVYKGETGRYTQTNIIPVDYANPYLDVDATVQMISGGGPGWVVNENDAELMFYTESAQSRVAILKLTTDGVLTGDVLPDGTRRFRPTDTLNRAEAVKILLKAREVYGDRSPKPENTELKNIPPAPCA